MSESRSKEGDIEKSKLDNILNSEDEIELAGQPDILKELRDLIKPNDVNDCSRNIPNSEDEKTLDKTDNVKELDSSVIKLKGVTECATTLAKTEELVKQHEHDLIKCKVAEEFGKKCCTLEDGKFARFNVESEGCVNVHESTVTEDRHEGTHGIDDANLRYEGDVCIYTEPESKCEFLWNKENQEWIPKESTSAILRENNLDGKDYVYDGKTYTYTDKDTGTIYSWDLKESKWRTKDQTNNQETDGEDEEEVEGVADGKQKSIARQDMTKGEYGFEGDTHTYTDTSDGTIYLWDKEKNAWFPKVDDDFLAQYQMNYGFGEPKPHSEEETKAEKVENETENAKQELLKKRKGLPQEPTWFEVDKDSNTKVYVSGLPSDITETEFVDVMQKYGLVMRDADSSKMKVKLYTDSGSSQLKGDGLCTYIKRESVDLALKLLDGYELRGSKLRVEEAQFTMKGGSYDPGLKPKKKRRKDKEKIKKMQEKLFDWRPDKLRGERSKHESVVIVKNLFEPSMFNKDVALILEYQQDLREEAIKCGDIRKVTIYDRHPEGVGQINFKEAEAADACVQLLNNRWFGQRKITAETWDGKTKYKTPETPEETKLRLEKWQKHLEAEEEKEKLKQIEKDKANVKYDSDQETLSSAGSGTEDDEEVNT